MKPALGDNAPYDVSIIIVSFNTRDLLRDCLRSAYEEATGLRVEMFVVDNASKDGSADMVATEFPEVKLRRSAINLGFGVANNVALEEAEGKYFVLLNSDAFFKPGALRKAIAHMNETPDCGYGAAKLMGRDGSWQPSARSFHSLWRDFTVLTGMAARNPKSKLYADFDRTWADQDKAASVDWGPGAFAILRPAVLEKVGLFDPDFFLYYEEVDLCKRIKDAGFSIWYWPDIEVIHLGGESSKTMTKSLDISSMAAQVVKWRMRSTLMYYRKHHGMQAWLVKGMEQGLYWLTVMKNRKEGDDEWTKGRAERHRTLIKLMDQAWKDTNGGRVSPPAPW